MFNDRLTRMLATFFYIGYAPAAPGTLASLAGAVIAIALHSNLLLYILVFLVVTVIGFQVSDRAEELEGQKDPSCIVIDEVAGIMIAFFLLPIDWRTGIVAFFLFRAFDMFKIYPVNKFESLKGGRGVMMDDLFAGLYTNLTMQIALRIAGII